ncbi:MAG: CpsD/CapB family tyrosine-protein kinase [Candidatus Omnitrophica bacterium]|nr:CpsD/CapB family tyrosine-protein kinase [Candidatus Omnitrophota bacterium]
MGKITDALRKVTDDRITRIQRKPEIHYVVRKVENSKIEEHIVAFHDPSSPIGEQYKILRTNIQTANKEKGHRAFIITSSINGEGKTVTAINLAITMAHDLNNKSILLIDADMRKAKVSRYLGINMSPGLSETLKGDAEIDETFVSPGIPNLTVVPAGKPVKNPAELLGSKKMESLISSLKSRFDYIFIDTPPLMPVTDACLLGHLTDGAIMVLQAGRTQREIVAHAETRLRQAGGRIMGYVVTNVEFHLPQYLYRYVHDYGHYAYQAESVAK